MIFCFINLAFAHIYKGELYFYKVEDKGIFTLLYYDVPMIRLFDRSINQTSSSFLIFNDIKGNFITPLNKMDEFWQDEQKKYKINASKILVYDQRKFQGEDLEITTLELMQDQNGIRIKDSLDFIGFKGFHPDTKACLVSNKFAKNLFF